MSVEGVWKVEMLGPQGWEPITTAFLRNGRYLAASAYHYSIGSYEESGETIKIEVRTIQHGTIRTVFGVKKKQHDLTVEGRIENADEIAGRAKSAEGGSFDLRLRLTRLGELD